MHGTRSKSRMMLCLGGPENLLSTCRMLSSWSWTWRGMWAAQSAWMAPQARCISSVTRHRTRSTSALLCPSGRVYASPFASLQFGNMWFR